MKTEEIIKLPLGTKVYLIHNAEISSYVTLGYHPNHKDYFYLQSKLSISDTMCLYLKKEDYYIWEIDYDKAKEIMWEQFKDVVKSKNKIFMGNKKSINFEL